MNVKILVFRHAETTDNARSIFSGWRDPRLTPKGSRQAQEVANQLKDEEINYAFTSHLRRARDTLDIVLKPHPKIPVFADDRLIERCYGTLQGKSKIRVSKEQPEWYDKIHRGYDFPPPEGESLKMVEQRTIPFLNQLKELLQRQPGNVAISCHGNSMRPIRRVFENLTLKQMLQLENPQDRAMEYALDIHEISIQKSAAPAKKLEWNGRLIPSNVKLATDPRNPLKEYYESRKLQVTIAQ
jgi:2,3-bisphosphoglycerate-dependent phosphoglycerate mutase